MINFVKGKICKQMKDLEEKNPKFSQNMKATATGTLELDESEPLEIDLAELMIW